MTPGRHPPIPFGLSWRQFDANLYNTRSLTVPKNTELRVEAKMQSGFNSLHVVAATLAVLGYVRAGGAVAQEDPKDIIAAQLRAQGYACDHPTNVTRDSGASKPNETVWYLVCEQATYRARLVPKMAAQVELLSENEKSSSAPR